MRRKNTLKNQVSSCGRGSARWASPNLHELSGKFSLSLWKVNSCHNNHSVHWLQGGDSQMLKGFGAVIFVRKVKEIPAKQVCFPSLVAECLERYSCCSVLCWVSVSWRTELVLLWFAFVLSIVWGLFYISKPLLWLPFRVVLVWVLAVILT